MNVFQIITRKWIYNGNISVLKVLYVLIVVHTVC